MTDHQITLLAAAISAGAPLLAVLVGILLNQMQIRGVDNRLSDMNDRYKTLNEDIREIRRDIKEIVSKLGAMDLEIAKLMDKR